jgi:hypothetical protein
MVEKQNKTQTQRRFIPEETLEHARSARAEFRKSVESLLPPGFVEHRRAARREMLLAFRSLIDAALERE